MATIWDGILEESKMNLAAEKNGKWFIGALWFEPICQEVKEVLAEVEIPDNASDKEVADAAYSLCEKFGRLAKDGSTYRCIKHWAFINGLAERMED